MRKGFNPMTYKPSWIEKWTIEVNRINSGILNWASGVNDTNVNSPFWKKNKTSFIVFGLLVLFTGIFYLLNWSLFFRIMGLMLILFIVSNMINEFFNLIKRFK